MNVMSWGGLRLYYQGGSTPIGRSIVVQSPAKGSKHFTSDRGAEVRIFEAEVIFCRVEEEELDQEQRYQKLLELIDGTPRLLVHPRHGAYLARVRNARVTDGLQDDAIRVSLEFVPDEPVAVPTALGPGASNLAGPEAVASAAAQLDEDLRDQLVPIDSPANTDFNYDLTADTAATAEGWSDSEGVSSAQVASELAAQIFEIDQAIEELELATLENWETFRSAMILRARLLDAANAVTTPAPRYYKLLVEADTSLAAICTQEYGAAEGARQRPTVAEVNNLRRPYVIRGTTLLMPIAGG